MEYLINLINDVGYWGYAVLFLIIFLESFPFTFYLPGDSLLFTTGFLASQGHFNLFLLFIVLYIGGTSGYFFSYSMGEKIRDFILRSNDKYWFKKKHIDYTRAFYDKYGIKTLIIGRFVPIIRSFAPTLAGAVKMNYRSFTLYTIFGGFVWTVGMTSLGYFLGRAIPSAHLYLTPIILGIIFVSFLPTVYDLIVSRRNRKTENVK